MSSRSNWPVTALCSMLLLLSACSTASLSAAASSPTSAPPPSATPTQAQPTSTPTLATQACTGTTPQNTFYQDLKNTVPFPAGAVLIYQSVGQYDGITAATSQNVDVCVNGTTPSAVRSYYNSQMAKQNWVPSAIFPYDFPKNLYPKAACGDPYCWRQGNGTPQNYGSVAFVSLENVRAAQTATLFRIRWFAIVYNNPNG